MKSMMYIVFGKPCTLDDCVDVVRSRRATKITVMLEQARRIDANCFATVLYARIELYCEKNRTRVARVRCGSLRDSWRYAKRLDAYRKANAKLERCLAQIRALGATVEGADNSFGSAEGQREQALQPVAGCVRNDVRKPPEGQQTSTASPYSRFANGQLILRDELAIDRTLLANERTVLAYLRSGIALVIAGVSIINFATHEWFMLVGFCCMPVGVITGVIGLVRYRKMDYMIGCVRKNMMQSAEPLAADDV